MKKKLKKSQVLAVVSILILSTSCSKPLKNDLPGKTVHPALIKTQGNQKYGNVQCALQDKYGNFWFGTTDNGLYKYDGKSFVQFLVSDGLNSNNISSLLEDNEGRIWIGTDAGLCRYDGSIFSKIEIPFKKNLEQGTNSNTNSTKWVFDIMQAKNGKLWFATIDGVYIYDGKSFSSFTVNEKSGGYLSSRNNVERILEDKAGHIWLGGRGNNGVYRYDGNSIVNFNLKELTIVNESVRFEADRVISHQWAVPQLQDKNGNIWFSNWGGVYRYNGRSFTAFTKTEGLDIGAVTQIADDQNGKLWFGGEKGLARYDGKAFTRFRNGLKNPWIWTILNGKSGNLWVGTRETGLYLFDGKTFENYSAYKK